MAFSAAAAVNGVAAALDAANSDSEEEEDTPGVGSKYHIAGAAPDKAGRRLPKLKIKRGGGAKHNSVQADQADLDTLTDAIYRALVSYYKRKVGYIQVCKYLVFIFVFLCMIMMQANPYYEMHSQAKVVKEGLFPDFVEDEMGFPGGRVPSILQSWSDVEDFIAGPVVALFDDPAEGDEVCSEPHEFQMWRGFGSPDCGVYPKEKQTELTITFTLKPELTPQQEAEICQAQQRSFRLTKETQYNDKNNLFTIAVLMQEDDTREEGGAETWVPRTGEELVLGDDLTAEELEVMNTQIKGFQPGTYRIAHVETRLDIDSPGCEAGTTNTNANSVSQSNAGSSTSASCVREAGACSKSSDCCDSASNYCELSSGVGYCAKSNSDSYGSSCMQDGSPCSAASMCCSYECDQNGKCANSYGGSRRQLSDQRQLLGRQSSGRQLSTTTETTKTCYMYFDVGIVPKSVYDAKKGLTNPNEWRRSENRLDIPYCNNTNSSNATGVSCSDKAKITQTCDCAGSADGISGKYCISGAVFPKCATGEALSAGCGCPSSDESVADNSGYAAGMSCVPGGDTSTAGSFTAGPVCSDTQKITATCNCAGSADGTAEKYCISGVVLPKCASGETLSAECGCPSSDESVAYNSGYVAGKTCVPGNDASTPGSFADMGGRRRLAHDKCSSDQDCAEQEGPNMFCDTATNGCKWGKLNECSNFQKLGQSCDADASCRQYDEFNYACDKAIWCDAGSSTCTDEMPANEAGGGTGNSAVGVNSDDWYITFREPFCNGTKVPNGTFPARDIGTVWGVKGFGAGGQCTIDNERKVKAVGSWNVCMENPLTKTADFDKCIFNDGAGKALDSVVGGVVNSDAAIVQTKKVRIVDADWLVVVKGVENAAVTVNFNWTHSKTGAINSKNHGFCFRANRTRKHAFSAGLQDTGCAAVEAANPQTEATECSSLTCGNEEQFFPVTHHFEKGSKHHYFPDEDGARERYFRGTANKMVGGVLVRQTRYEGGTCSPGKPRYAKLFSSSQTSFPCINKETILKPNEVPFGVDPVYLSSSSMYDGKEWARRKEVYTKDSEYKANGLPFAFTVAQDPESVLTKAALHGFPVVLQNNYRASIASRVANLLKEGYYVDELTKDVRVTLINYNPYVECYTYFEVRFSQSYPSGEVKVNYDHYTFNVASYEPDFHTAVRVILEILYYAFVVTTILEELWELALARAHGKFYFTDAWNYIEIGCAALQVWNSINWVQLILAKDKFLPQEQYVVYPLQAYRVGGLLANRNEPELAKMLGMYDQAANIVSIERDYKNINMIVGFLLMFRLMKQLDFHPRLGVITRTLQQAFSSLMHFLAVFLVLMGMFMVLGIYAFGQNTDEFSDVHGAWFVFYHLLQGDLMILGTLVMSNNSGINTPLAWMYLVLFFIIIFLIMLNVLLAIMIDAYTDARDRASEDALETSDSVIVEASSILWHEFKAMCYVRGCICKKKKNHFVTSPIVKLVSGLPVSEEHADEENEKARIAAELREVIAAAMHTGHHKPVDQNGVPLHMIAPRWESIYYKLKYDRPYKTVMKESSLLRTARGDLTEDELIAVIHHQLKRYDIDLDPNTELSKRVAKTVLWRYGKSIDIKQRREIGPEHRNVMNEHRFNRLEEQLATIVVAGASQWQGMEQIMKTVQAMPLDRNTGMASLAAVASANAQQTSTSGSI